MVLLDDETSDVTPTDGERVWAMTEYGIVRQAIYRESPQPHGWILPDT